MMKRFLAITIMAVVALASVAQAQENKNDVKFEITAGVNAAGISTGKVVSRVGFHAGVRAYKDFKFFTAENALYGNVAALLSLKGGKMDTEDGKVTFNPYFLEIPIHLGYSHKMSESAKFFYEMGPYFSIGLFGKSDGVPVFSDLNFRRFDFGLGLRTGFDFCKHYSLGVGFDVGLVHIVKTFDTGTSKNLYISAGYKF